MSQTDPSVAPRKPKQAHRVPPYRRPLVVGGFLAILAIVIVVTVLICKNLNDMASKPSDSTTTPSQSEVTPPDPVEPQPDDDLENKAPQYEGGDANDWDTLTGNIVYRDIDPETQVLHSAVSIDQYLQEGGQCVFNLRRGDGIIRTASMVASADVTTSVCGPFAISVDGLSGTYQIEVVVTGDGKRGVITSEITIE